MQDAPHANRWPLIASLLIFGILLFWLGFSIFHSAGQHDVAADPYANAQPYVPSGPGLHPVLINAPDGPPALQVGIHPQTGAPITASCTTCHSTRTPNPDNATTQDLDQFHIGLKVAHGAGALSCLSCHNPDNYETLRAANGSAITYTQSITLCAQCHSAQHEDYQHGAHGGMNGYWDLSKGARTRNTCIDCHDPHAPAYPQMRPTFKPIDRGLTPDTHTTNPKGKASHE